MPDKTLFLSSDHVYCTEIWDEDNPVFIQISRDMSQLNRFCTLCLEATFGAFTEADSDLDIYKRQKANEIDSERLGNLDDWISELETIDVPFWKDNADFVAPAMCLIMLAAFLEKSLKSICLAYAPRGKSLPIQEAGENKVSAYLRLLKDDCGFRFEEPKATMQMWDRCRRVRNFFAHGDWDNTKTEIAKMNLRDAFNAVAELLTEIERGYYEGRQR